jgi:hypothetical protein
MHRLSDTWVLWAHLPHDSNWTIDSYIPIMTISYVEEMLTLIHTLPEKLITDCMLFLMKEHITPTWEDAHNKNGGCFSYKITNRISDSWRDMSYSISGKSLTKDASFNKDITGISISPKKNFCILKLWMGSCTYQDPSKITILKPTGCIFKKH